jgi:type VI secretion system protein ImpB
MMADSVYGKLGQRGPRVHITYDVELGGATEVKELPFVMGVLGDFTGQPEKSRLAERKFVEVTPDNFDDVLQGLNPRLAFSVPDRLGEQGGELGVELHFTSLRDFEPDRVAMKVPRLADLLKLRERLSDLRGRLQSNGRLEEILQASLGDAASREQLKRELGPEGGDHGDR